MTAVLSFGPDPTDVIGRRILAWIVDAVILGAVMVLAAILYFQASAPPEGFATTREQEAFAEAFVFDLYPVWIVTGLAYALVRILLVGLYGWSPGKLFLGLRVVGWDGRPPGFGKAAIREFAVWLLDSFLGCFYWLVGLGFMLGSRGHRQPADFAARTYVIDSVYLGRLIMVTQGKTRVGPESVRADEAEELLRSSGLPVPPPGKRMTEPFFDKGRDTYVVYSKKEDAWMQFEKSTKSWKPLS